MINSHLKNSDRKNEDINPNKSWILQAIEKKSASILDGML